MEDAVCAGMLIHKLKEMGHETVEYGDAGAASVAMYKTHSRSLLKMLKNSEHGKYLHEIGFGDDVKYCSQVDSVSVVPQSFGNAIKLKKDAEPARISVSP